MKALELEKSFRPVGRFSTPRTSTTGGQLFLERVSFLNTLAHTGPARLPMPSLSGLNHFRSKRQLQAVSRGVLTV